MDLLGKNVLVIGLGKTGEAAVRFLLDRGAQVTATDIKMPQAIEPGKGGINLTGLKTVGYDPSALEKIDLVVPSPGVPPGDPILREAEARRIKIISEIELAFRFATKPLIAITGTNGKTTTTTLVGELLKKGGMKVFVGGNIGAPLIGYVGGSQDDDYLVVEVSSFQLSRIETFHPRIAVLLNITEDHLDYHGTFAAYQRAKEMIFVNQMPEDLAILNADEPWAPGLALRLASRQMCFSSQNPMEKGIFLRDDVLIRKDGEGGEEEYPLDMIRLPGLHNVENVMAAILVARECHVAPGDIIHAIRAFGGIPHRIEYAGEISGVKFYDDSKGTNVGAVDRALKTFTRPVILLMGGRDKEGDFSGLVPQIKSRVKTLVIFGEAKEKIRGQLGGLVPTMIVERLGEAVVAAYRMAEPDDVVLLSPGCASFDEFSDYKARGRFFKDVVKNIRQRD